LKIRVATYNILNTSDRYEERERLLKENLYELNADVIGLQEVAFGSKQLDELKHPHCEMGTLRHSVEHYGRHKGYKVYEAPF
jgi:endonuclease/exonuclease/phosphatase family metal-dependent hydrolase